MPNLVGETGISSVGKDAEINCLAFSADTFNLGIETAIEVNLADSINLSLIPSLYNGAKTFSISAIVGSVDGIAV